MHHTASPFNKLFDPSCKFMIDTTERAAKFAVEILQIVAAEWTNIIGPITGHKMIGIYYTAGGILRSTQFFTAYGLNSCED